MDAQLLGHADDGRQDDAAFLGEGMEKGHVQFQRVEAIIFQYVQRGIAAAEIVEPDFETGFPETAQSLADGFILKDQGIFRDFRAKKISGQLVSRQGFFQHLCRVHELEIEAGKVEGHGQGLLASFHLIVEKLSHLVCDIAVQPVDEAELFQRRDEQGRREQTVFRRIPAGQGLETAYFAIQGADDGLTVHLDVMVFKGFVQVFPHIVLQFVKTSHFSGVDGIMTGRILGDGFAGQSGVIVEGQRQGFRIRKFTEITDARLHFNVRIGNQVLYVMTGCLDARGYIRCIRQDGEVIGAQMSQEPAWKIFLEDLGNLLQAMISLVDAARRIVKAEIGNIEENRTGFQSSPSVPFPFQFLPGCPIKGLHGKHGIVCFFHNSPPYPILPGRVPKRAGCR